MRTSRGGTSQRSQRLVALAVLAAAVLALGDPLPAASKAPAAEEETSQATTTTTAPEEDGTGDATEIARGTLRYTAESGERIPVEDAEIIVRDGAGDEVDTVTTDAEGLWEVGLPGPGTYVFQLDTDSLPDGVNIREEDDVERRIPFSVGDRKAVLFPLILGATGSVDVRAGDSLFDRSVRLAVSGIQFGLVIAMAAIGLSLIFGTTGLVNFAHGELVTFGALMAFLLNVTFGLHLLIAAPLAIVIGATAGGLLETVFWRPLRNHGTGLVAMLVISIGLSILLRYIFVYQFGGFFRSFGDYTLQTTPLFEIGPLRILPRDAVIMVSSVVVLLAVAAVLQRTKIGKAIRAVADNADLAAASGININRVILAVWVAGSALAALGGIYVGLSEQVDWLLGVRLLLLMFAGIVLGGLGTAYGALVGSLVVGVFVQMSTLVVAPELKNVGALLILILILLVRPQGILGQAERVG